MKVRRGPRAASSPSPATARSIASRTPSAGAARYKIAEAALGGYVYAPVGWATHYHADYVVPYWASTLAKNAIVGAHIFYRWAGGWGQPAIFDEGLCRARAERARAAQCRACGRGRDGAAQGQTVAEAIEKIPGAEAIKLAPSMRGDKRVAVRFNLAARKASDDAPHEDYAKKFEASDNLKWALSGDAAAADEKPLGKASRRDAGGRAVRGSAAARP